MILASSSLAHLVDGLALGLVLGVALLLVRLLALRLCHLLNFETTISNHHTD